MHAGREAVRKTTVVLNQIFHVAGSEDEVKVSQTKPNVTKIGMCLFASSHLEKATAMQYYKSSVN